MVNLTYIKRRKYIVTQHSSIAETTPIVQGRIECEINQSMVYKFLIHVSDEDPKDPKVNLFTISLNYKEAKKLHEDIGKLLPALKSLEQK